MRHRRRQQKAESRKQKEHDQRQDEGADRRELVELIQANRLMRIPAYEGHPDNIKGLISARDCLLNPDLPPAQLLAPPGPGEWSARDVLAHLRACADGSERAWEIFMVRFREKLYDIAAYITKESSAARELADGVYGDLYGTVTRDGQRVCKLSSYTGRGSLEGWLRTVLAQEHPDCKKLKDVFCIGTVRFTAAATVLTEPCHKV